MLGHGVIPTEASLNRWPVRAPGLAQPCRDVPHQGKETGPLPLCMDQTVDVVVPGEGSHNLGPRRLAERGSGAGSGPRAKGGPWWPPSVHSTWSGCSFHVQNRGHPFCSENPSCVLFL